MSATSAVVANFSEDFARTDTVDMLLGLIRNMGDRINDLQSRVTFLEMMIIGVYDGGNTQAP